MVDRGVARKEAETASQRHVNYFVENWPRASRGQKGVRVLRGPSWREGCFKEQPKAPGRERAT